MDFLVMGLGRWGRTWTEVLAAHPQARIVGAADPVPDAARWCADVLGVPYAADWRALLRDVPADAVLVVTPPQTHAEIVRAALATARHVLVEKPLAASLAEAVELEKLARASARRVLVGQGYRFTPLASAVREIVASDRIGRVRTIRIQFRRCWPRYAPSTHFVYSLPHALLNDMAVHHLDLVRLWTGLEAREVSGVQWETPENAFCTPSAMQTTARLTDGTLVQWEGDWCSPPPATLWEGDWELIGEGGRLRIVPSTRDPEVPVLEIHARGQPVARQDLPEGPSDRRIPLLDHFIGSLEAGVAPSPDVTDNLGTLRWVFAAIRSLETGRPERADGE